MSELTRFLETSAVARRTKVAATVVIARTMESTRELSEARARGEYGPVAIDPDFCELEVGGRVVAFWKLVKRGGRACFRITGFNAADGSRGESL